MLAVQVSPENQKRLDEQVHINEKAFHAATSNGEFQHGLAPAYETWAATSQTQKFAGDVEYLYHTEEVQRVGAHLDQAGQNVHEIENGLYIDNKVLEDKLAHIEAEVKALES